MSKSKKKAPKNRHYEEADLFIEQPNFFRPKKVKLSDSQEDFKELIMNNTITFGVGPAGSSKTFTACYTALQLLREGKYEKIILTRPIQESGEELGHLPGELDAKTAVYAYAFWDTLNQIADAREISHLKNNNIIEFRPLAYMRGTTMRNAVMILDEAQNLDFRQLMLYVTRLGANSKIIITGDASQHDIRLEQVGLLAFTKMIDGTMEGMSAIEGVAVHHFSNKDIVRNPILIQITERYEQLKADGKLPKNKKM
jgi:phosphate starvation-inducible protein PhoH and related proteins